MSGPTLPEKLPQDQAHLFQRVQNIRETQRALLVLNIDIQGAINSAAKSFANGDGGADPTKQHQTVDRPFTDWRNPLTGKCWRTDG